MSILKIFAPSASLAQLPDRTRIIARYDAFVIVEASAEAARGLARRFPIEDITDQYRLQLGDKRIDTLAALPSERRKAARKATGKPGTTAALRRPAKVWTASPLGPGAHHYVVQFIGPIKRPWLASVRATGAKLREPHGGFGYVVRATGPQLAKIAALAPVLWVGHLPHRARLAPGLAARGKTPTTLPRRKTWPGAYRVELFDAHDVDRVARAARSIGFSVQDTDPKARLLSLHSESAATARRKQLTALSAVHGVRFIRERVLPRPSNNVATKLMANAYVATSSSGLKLAGEGEIVAVCDSGLDTGIATTIHPDFAGRIIAIKSYPITPGWAPIVFNPGANDGAADLDTGHGTHVAASVLGDGTASSGNPAIIRGHAHKARLVFQAVEQEMDWKPSAPEELRSERYVLSGIPDNLLPLFQFAYGQGARIHSNSWGGGDPGAYDPQCRQFDQFVWDHADFCFVVAAGNDGTDRDGDGKINLMSVTSPGTAKNCITIGASENQRPEFDAEKYGDWWPDDYPVEPSKSASMANDPAQVVAFSSRGPTADGRVKPDLVAPGTFILSARSTQIAPNNFAWAAYPPNPSYFHMGGTSMATPLVAGAVALVREYLRKHGGITNPSAALLKAMLIAGAQRVPGTSPAGALLDYHQGFGRVNLDRSLRRVIGVLEGPGLATGQNNVIALNVPVSGKTLRIAMAYSDFPGDRLVNNLNLVANDPAGKGYVGNQALAGGATLVMDTVNNVEVIQVKNAKKGNWTITVIGSNVGAGPQPYAVAAVLV